MVEIEGINPLVPTLPLRREERHREGEQQPPEGHQDEHMPSRSRVVGDEQQDIDEYV